MNRHLSLLLIFAAGVCFTHLHQGHLAGDGIRYAHIAKSILVRADWLNLYDGFQNTEHYANKPHLLFWLLALTFKTFGYSTFFAKLPSAVFVFASLILLGVIAKDIFGQKLSLVLVALFVCTRVFMRDILDLNVEGISLFGALLCLYSTLPRTQQTFSSALRPRIFLFLGILLLFQSKTPFLLLFLFPVASFSLIRNWTRWRPLLPYLLALFLLGLCSLLGFTFYFAEEYFLTAVDNQWINPIRANDHFGKNVLDWIAAILLSWAPLSWFGLWELGALLACCYKSRSLSALDDSRRFLLLWSLSLFPIMLLVDCRPRYALFPMLAITLLAGYRLVPLLNRVRTLWLERTLILVAALCVLAFSVLDIPIHRSDKTVHAIAELPDSVQAQDYVVCIEREFLGRSLRTAKFSELLLDLEQCQLSVCPHTKVYHPDSLPRLKTSTLVLANHRCGLTLENREKQPRVLAELPKGYSLLSFQSLEAS